MTKIVPLGGKHKSARSMLAEVMNDPDMVKCVVVTLSAEGNAGWGHFDMTVAELAYAAGILDRMAFNELDC